MLLPTFLQGDVDNVVNVNDAYLVPSVWEAITVISRSIARAPLFVETGENKRDYDHPMLSVITKAKQPEYVIRQTMVSNLALHGEAFALILDNRLVPLKPGGVVWVSRTDNLDKIYRLNDGRLLMDDEMFHVLGNSIDGVRGISPLKAHGLTLNLARAVDEYGQKFFKQRRPVMVLQTQGDLDEEIAEAIAKRYAESAQDYGLFVADKNSELKPVTGSPNEAQFNETRQSMVLAVARIFGIPPSKLGVLDYSTFNNITEENTSFVRECLQNFSAPLENAFEFWFGFKLRHDFSSLLEQTWEQKASSVSLLVDKGILTPNEGRGRLNYPSMKDGDELRNPMTMQEPEEDEGQSHDNKALNPSGSKVVRR